MANRREFLQQISSAAVVSLAIPLLLYGEPASLVPMAFSTLGCPAWDWPKILSFAHEHGFKAIELRGLQGSMDLPANPIFAADRIEQTKKEIHSADLKIACVSSSANLYFDDPARRDQSTGRRSPLHRFGLDLGSALRPCLRRQSGVGQESGAGRRDEKTCRRRLARAWSICRSEGRDRHDRIARSLHIIGNAERCSAGRRLRSRRIALGRASYFRNIE